ncbi:hypothetical protein ACOME3_002587 [Neoechinorhynchus agilis]
MNINRCVLDDKIRRKDINAGTLRAMIRKMDFDSRVPVTHVYLQMLLNTLAGKISTLDELFKSDSNPNVNLEDLYHLSDRIAKRNVSQIKDIKKDILQFCRLALTGVDKGIPLLEIFDILGHEECSLRLQQALKRYSDDISEPKTH